MIFFFHFALHFSIKAAFTIHWFNPLGIGCLTETIHIALHYDQLKVFEGVQLITADFGLVMVKGRKVPHQNRLPFSLLLSFGSLSLSLS
jgi:hypothetical protein